MKELILFRIFALFPFIGIIAPDIANALHNFSAAMPTSHVIVDLTLGICILICSGGIWVAESHELKAAH